MGNVSLFVLLAKLANILFLFPFADARCSSTGWETVSALSRPPFSAELPAAARKRTRKSAHNFLLERKELICRAGARASLEERHCEMERPFTFDAIIGTKAGNIIGKGRYL